MWSCRVFVRPQLEASGSSRFSRFWEFSRLGRLAFARKLIPFSSRPQFNEIRERRATQRARRNSNGSNSTWRRPFLPPLLVQVCERQQTLRIRLEELPDRLTVEVMCEFANDEFGKILSTVRPRVPSSFDAIQRNEALAFPPALSHCLGSTPIARVFGWQRRFFGNVRAPVRCFPELHGFGH